MATKLTTIQDALPSDDFTVGGESWNQIIKILKNVNVESEEDLTINTSVKWQSGKLILLDSGAPSSHSVIVDVENIVTGLPRHLTVRAFDNTTDYITTELQPAVLLSKTLGNATVGTEAKFGRAPDFQGFGLDNVGIIKIKDTGGRNVSAVEVSGTTPNTQFEVFSGINTANFAALSTATNIKVRFGFGSEIDGYEFWSQADGSNSKIFSVSETLFDIPATTVDFHNSTINNISLAKTQIPSTVVNTDQNNTYGDFTQFFRNQRMRIRNPLNSFSLILDVPAILADRTVSFPLLGGNDTLATVGFANVFTDLQTIQKDLVTVLSLYRPANTAANNVGLTFDAQSSTSVKRSYAAIYGNIVANTNAAESGMLLFQTMLAGSLGTAMSLNHNGSLFIGRNQRLGLVETGLTTQKLFTFPDSAGEVDIINASQALTNKTINFALNTGTNIGDSAIAAHTSTKITITAKGQLNAQIAYLDATAWLTNAMVSGSAAIDWTKINKTGSLLSDMANVILTTPTSQDLLIRNATSQWINLAKGANNTMLGVNGSGNLAYSTVADANIATHTSTKISITAKGQLNAQIAYLDATAWLTDAMVAAHTSTKITITAKGQLNSSILYSDVDNAIGAHYIQMDKIANPTAAPAGKLKIFASTVTGFLSQIDEAGVITDITAGTGGGGTGDVTSGVSLGGIAIYKQENASHVLEFKGLNSPNSTITFGANADGLRVDADVTDNSITNAKIVSLAYTKLTSVPSTFAPSAHFHAGSDITSGVVGPTFGGTGKSTFTQHALLKGGAANAFSEIAPSTDGLVLKMVSGTPAWAAESGGGTTGAAAYSYIIYKTGSNYIAYNTVTKVEQYSNTTAHTTINSVITAMNTAGGGTALIKAGLYPITAPIIPQHFCKLLGENKYNTIFRNMSNAANTTIFRYWLGATSTLLDSFELENIQFQIHNLNGDGTGETEAVWISSGTRRFKMTNCIIKSFATGGTFMKIGFFLDTAGNTNLNDAIEIRFNTFTGSCGGQDMLGMGNTLDCEFNNNHFIDCTSQAMGVGASFNSKYNENRFVRVGNCVGLESNCYGNEINDNQCYITSGIKLSGETTSINISTRNSCCRNKIHYGTGGIEDGNAHGDTIEDNEIYRTQRNGIRGTFVNSSIQRNKLVDTNFGNFSQTINTVSSQAGGIVMENNTDVANPIPDADNNIVKDNILIDTGTTFTDPVTSTSVSGNTGPIILDTTYDNNTVLFNKFQGLTGGDVKDYSTNIFRIEADSRLARVQSNLEDNFNIYRKAKAVNDRIGITIEGDDSTDTRVVYGKIQMQIVDPVSTTKDSYLSVRYVVGNTIGEKFYAYNNGIGFGSSGATSIEQYSGVSGGVKTITWGNFSGEPAIINAGQILTNKWIQGIRGNYNPKTGSYSAVITDDFIPVDATSGNVTITLPTAVGIGGKTFTFTKTDATASTVIIDGLTTETINGALTYTLTAQYQTITIWSNNVGWFVDTHVHSAADITTGTLGVTRGGTGKNTMTQHALLKGGAGNTLTEIAPSTDGLVLKMVSGTPAWAAESGGGGATTLDALTDVVITSPAAGQIIYHNGTNFVNSPSTPLKNGPFLYHIYIDIVDSKFKALNLDTLDVEFISTGTTDALALFNSVIAAASTAKRPIFVAKGKYPFSAAPTIAGKWIHIKGSRVGHSGGSQGDYTSETVFKKTYTDATNPFFNWDGSTTWTQQLWEDVYLEGKDSNNDGTGTWDNSGIGFQIKSTSTAISEIYDVFRNVNICHFGTGLKLMKCYQLTFHDLSIYKCGTKGVWLTDDGTTGQCVEIIFRGGEVRFAPTNAHVEKATHTKFDQMMLEGDNASPYTQVNSVKIDAGGHATRIDKCSFENNTVGPITQILDAGYGTEVEACRFGGITWTAQTILNVTGVKCNFLNNLIEPYATNGVATILLSSGSKHCNILFNHVAEAATGTALVITDNSGNSTTNLQLGNTSGSAVLDNVMGRNTTFLSPPTIQSDPASSSLLNLYRPVTTAFAYNAIQFDLQSSTGVRKQFARIVATSDSNTNGAEETWLGYEYMTGGVSDMRGMFYNNGVYFGPNGSRAGINNSGLSANRTFTLPNLSGALVIASQLTAERTGKALGNGGTTGPYTIAHGLGTGSTPSYVYISCASHAIATSFTVDATNITVTFASAPSAGTNNVIIYWRVIA